MFSTKDLISLLATYEIQLPDNLLDMPEEFKGFKGLAEYIHRKKHLDIAKSIEDSLPLLNEALCLQEVEKLSKIILPILPTATLVDSLAYSEQDLLRLLTCPTQLATILDRPLTLDDTFQDPITLPNGETYERTAFVEAWKKMYQSKPIPEGLLRPNIIIKNLAERMRTLQDVNQVDFDELFEDPLTNEVFKNDMVLDTNGNTYKNTFLEQWLNKSKSCPSNPDLPCIAQQLRPNRILGHIQAFYDNHLKPKPDPITALRKVGTHLSVSKLQEKLNHFFDALDYLSTPQDSSLFKERSRLVISNLSNIFTLFTSPNYQLALQSEGLTTELALQHLLFVYQHLKDIVEYNKVLLDTPNSNTSNSFLNELAIFRTKIQLKERCLKPSDPLIFAKVNPISLSQMTLAAIVYNNTQECSPDFMIVLKVQKEHEKQGALVAKEIALAVGASVTQGLVNGSPQFQLRTNRLGSVLLAFQHLNLIESDEINELKSSFSEVIGNLDTLKEGTYIVRMLKNLDSGLDKLNNPSRPWWPFSIFSSSSQAESQPKDLNVMTVPQW
ncbi:hypothetical protein [Legionella sp. W05-934-2]|jgi:hypothetical protein|uniref:hypothetical protein n=1 Tax=Legionella sp. W05-934-2 TaxID=1198649 RepID=UPI0034628BA9